MTAVTLYPSLESTMTAILPTPPVAPVTKTLLTFSPNNSSSLAFTAKAQSKEVNPAVPRIIAFLLDIDLGFFTNNSPFTFTI